MHLFAVSSRNRKFGCQLFMSSTPTSQWHKSPCPTLHCWSAHAHLNERSMWLMEPLMDILQIHQFSVALPLQLLGTLPVVYPHMSEDGDAVSIESFWLILIRSAVIPSVQKNRRMKSSWNTLSTMKMQVLRHVLWSPVHVVMWLAPPKVWRISSMMCQNVHLVLLQNSASILWKQCSQWATMRAIQKPQRTIIRPMTLLTLFLLHHTCMLQVFQLNWSTTLPTRPYAQCMLPKTMPMVSCMVMAHSQAMRMATWWVWSPVFGVETMHPASRETVLFGPGPHTILPVVTPAWCPYGWWMSHL